MIVSDEENQHLCRLVTCFEALHADLAFLLSSVEHPENYGIAFGTESPEQHVFYIHKVIEKPSITKSNLAIMPIYIFKHEIFDYLKLIKPGRNNEIQLTDAIQMAIVNGKTVVGTKSQL